MNMKKITSLVMASCMAMSLASAPAAYAVDLGQPTGNYQWQENTLESQGEGGANGEIGTEGESGTEGEGGTEGEEGTEGEVDSDGEEGTEGEVGSDGEEGTEGEVGSEGEEGTEGKVSTDGEDDAESGSHSTASKRIGDCTIVLDKTSFKYDGTAKYPGVTVLNNLGQTLVENTDYTLRYSNNVGAGIGEVEVIGIAYTGSKSANFSIEQSENTIQAENVSRPATSSVPQSFYLNARAAAGTMTYSSDNEAVTVDRNGRVTVQPNFVGTAHITITASSQNMGEATKTIDVNIYRMQDEIFVKSISLEASESAINAPIRVNHRSSGALSYTFSDTNVVDDGKGNLNIAAGFSGVVHATVRSAAYGAYEAAEAEFTIYVVPKATEVKSVKIANDKGTKMKVSWKKNETAGGYRIQYSTDSDFEDDVEVINLQGNQTTSKTISDLKAGKTYYVRIQALSKGSTELTASWSDTVSLKVVSAPATTKLSKAVNKKGKKIKATWKKTSGASGYEIQYTTDKTFKSAKTIKVKGGSSTSKTIKGLKKKTYYVRIRTVKTVDGNNFYAKWSGYRTVKVRK